MDSFTRKNGFVLFWGSHMSNWAITPFTIDGVTYNSGEQWMMSEKAKFFGDEAALVLIMACNDPREQKKFGRTVANFDSEKWDKVCRERVFVGLLEKYRQNPKLAANLLATDDDIIVEASPYDKIWGIGLPEDHPDCTNPDKWKGKNYLGEVLMRVRKSLREEKNEAESKTKKPE